VVDRTEAVVVELGERSDFEGREPTAPDAEDVSAPGSAPHPTVWSYLGGLGLACFVVQAVTGLMLAFVYQATPDHAYTSVYYIAQQMPYGWLVRTIHVWGGQLLIVVASLHAIRAVARRSFTRPREANWLLGVLAALTTLALALTGGLLPWDGKSYWSTAENVALLRRLPLLGPQLVRGMLGDMTVGPRALTRFYAAHLTLLPAAFAAFIVAHVWLARRQAGLRLRPVAESPWRRDRWRRAFVAAFKSQRFVALATAFALLLCAIVVLSIVAPAPLGLKADPSAARVPASPAWYLLSLRALADLLTPAVAAAVPLLLGVAFAALPFVDRSLAPQRRGHDITRAVGFAVLAAMALLTLIGIR